MFSKCEFFAKTLKSSNSFNKSKDSRVDCGLYTIGVDRSWGIQEGPSGRLWVGFASRTPTGLPTDPQRVPKGPPKVYQNGNHCILSYIIGGGRFTKLACLLCSIIRLQLSYIIVYHRILSYLRFSQPTEPTSQQTIGPAGCAKRKQLYFIVIYSNIY